MKSKMQCKKMKHEKRTHFALVFMVRVSSLSPATDEWRRFNLLIPTRTSVTSWNGTICPLDCD